MTKKTLRGMVRRDSATGNRKRWIPWHARVEPNRLGDPFVQSDKVRVEFGFASRSRSFLD